MRTISKIGFGLIVLILILQISFKDELGSFYDYTSYALAFCLILVTIIEFLLWKQRKSR